MYEFGDDNETALYSILYEEFEKEMETEKVKDYETAERIAGYFQAALDRIMDDTFEDYIEYEGIEEPEL